jgi:hypothetical protein
MARPVQGISAFMANKVIVEVLMSVNAPNRRELVQTLGALREQEPEASEFFEDVETINRFLWRTSCTDREAAERWMDSQHYRTLMGAIRVLGTLEGVQISGTGALGE